MPEPLDPQAPDPLGQLGVGAVSALNSAAFGAPEFFTNLLAGKDAYENYIKAHDQPVFGVKPSDIGNIAGLGASLFIPGGIIAKGLGTAAKAATGGRVGSGLVKAGEYIAGHGGGIKNAIGRGVGVGMEQAVPRALFEQGNNAINGAPPSQMLSEGAGDVALSGLLGGAIGGTLGVGGKALGSLGRAVFGDAGQIAAAKAAGKPGKYGLFFGQNAPEQIREDAAKQAVGQLLGVNSRVARWLANMGPNYEKSPTGQATAVRQSVQDLADFMHRTGMRNLKDIEDYHSELKQAFNDAAAGLNKENTPFPSFTEKGLDHIKAVGEGAEKTYVANTPEWLSKSPAYQRFIASVGNSKAGEVWENYVPNLIERMNDSSKMFGKEPIQTLRGLLADDANAFRLGQTADEQAQSHLASAMKDALDAHAMDVVDKGKIRFPAYSGGSIEGLKKDYKDLGLFRLADRMEATNMMPVVTNNSDTQMKLMMQNLAGATLGGGVGLGTSSDENPMGRLGAGLIGATAGGLGAAGLRNLLNKGIGAQALKLNQALEGGAGSPAAQKIEAFKAAVTGQAPLAGSLAQGVEKLPAEAVTQGPPQAQIPAPQQMAPAVGQQQGQQMQMQGAAPSASQTLQGMGQYGRAVQGKIMQLYQQLDRVGGQLSAQGISPEEFATGIMNASQGFNPNIMANLLFPDESQRGEFLKSYQAVQQLQGLDVDSVVNTNPLVGGLGGSVLNGGYAATRNQLAQILSQTGKAADVKNAVDQIDRIQWLNVPIQQKRLMLAQLLQRNLGINKSLVHQYGLDEGTILEDLP